MSSIELLLSNQCCQLSSREFITWLDVWVSLAKCASQLPIVQGLQVAYSVTPNLRKKALKCIIDLKHVAQLGHIQILPTSRRASLVPCDASFVELMNEILLCLPTLSKISVLRVWRAERLLRLLRVVCMHSVVVCNLHQNCVWRESGSSNVLGAIRRDPFMVISQTNNFIIVLCAPSTVAFRACCAIMLWFFGVVVVFWSSSSIRRLIAPGSGIRLALPSSSTRRLRLSESVCQRRTLSVLGSSFPPRKARSASS